MNKVPVNVLKNFIGEGFILDFIEPFILFFPRRHGDAAIRVKERRLAVYLNIPQYQTVEECKRDAYQIMLLALLGVPGTELHDEGITDADSSVDEYGFRGVDELRVFVGSKFIGYILLKDVKSLLTFGIDACTHDPVDAATATRETSR